MEAEIVPLRESLPALQSEWQALFRAGRYEPCVSHEWTTALVEHRMRDHEDLRLVVLRRDGRLVGLVPLTHERRRFARIPIAVVRPIAEHYPTHSDLLIEDHDEAALEAFLRVVLAELPSWHEFRLARLLARERLAVRLAGAMRRIGLAHRITPVAPSFFLDLPDDFQGYLGARSSKFRNHLRRMEKALAGRGRLELKTCTSLAEVERMYAALLTIERESWKHANGTSIDAREHQRRFYRDVCIASAATGTLHLSVLFLDDRPIAHNLGLLDGQRYTYLKTSYVADLRRASPATVARAWLIRSLIATGVRELDFAAQPYEWELQWADALRPHVRLVAYGDSFRSRILSLMQATGVRARRLAGAFARTPDGTRANARRR